MNTKKTDPDPTKIPETLITRIKNMGDREEKINLDFSLVEGRLIKEISG